MQFTNWFQWWRLRDLPRPKSYLRLSYPSSSSCIVQRNWEGRRWRLSLLSICLCPRTISPLPLFIFILYQSEIRTAPLCFFYPQPTDELSQNLEYAYRNTPLTASSHLDSIRRATELRGPKLQKWGEGEEQEKKKERKWIKIRETKHGPRLLTLLPSFFVLPILSNLYAGN